MSQPWAHPVLSGAETKALEQRLFAGDEAAEWRAMQRAGRAVAGVVLEDFREIGGFPIHGRVLVLAGKGHNGGDALIAAETILQQQPAARADVLFVYGASALRPLALRAWQDLQHRHADHVRPVSVGGLAADYALSLDGVFGFQFRPPLDASATAALAAANALPVRLRAAVDLPSGLGEAEAFRADFTYGTGVLKREVLGCVNAGRLRYLDLGFFDSLWVAYPGACSSLAGGPTSASAGLASAGQVSAQTGRSRSLQRPGACSGDVYSTEIGRRDDLDFSQGKSVVRNGLHGGGPSKGANACDDWSRDFVITSDVLAPLRSWRDPGTEKRKQGHLFVLAGSRSYPGAALMAVMSALRSGAGLVSAFVPESLVPAFAAQVPEAIWIGWPETSDGGLALEGGRLLRERMERASALVLGPGLGRERETLALAADVLQAVRIPVIVDADALQPEVLAKAMAPLVLTPHAGEFARIAGGRSLRDFARAASAVVALKGPVTQVCAGGPVYHSLFGGPVLARGGSGDLLAGFVGAQVARTPDELLPAVCRGVVWHGRAADALARAHGAEAVRTTQLLDFLPAALRLDG